MPKRPATALRCRLLLSTLLAATFAGPDAAAEPPGGDRPSDGGRLAIAEDWASGEIDPQRWYALRKKWGEGNHGVVPENVSIERDVVDGRERNVLVCRAHGDRYDGPVAGFEGNATRVGGVLVTKDFFASGRFEVRMKIGTRAPRAGGPDDPRRPVGAVPAIWTYGYRYIDVPADQQDRFTRRQPLYNPHMKAYGGGANEYWSELDFPELGKQGDFGRGLYNVFCQNRYDWQVFDVPEVADGRYHTYTTEWRTRLKPLPEVTDQQVVEHEGHWWVQDRSVPFEDYLGNPLKRLGADRYAVRWGEKAEHWVDGVKVGENTRNVPAMAGQLNLGIWLPEWGGPAPWTTSRASFASIRVWQYDDPGDVRGLLDERITDNFDEQGRPQ